MGITRREIDSIAECTEASNPMVRYAPRVPRISLFPPPGLLMLDPSDTGAALARRRLPQPATARHVQVLGNDVERSLIRARQAAQQWRDRIHYTAGSDRDEPTWLLRIPDVGPACEAILADRLFADLRPDEKRGLLEWIRGSQDPLGAWLGLDGEPDLSLTVLGWWARAQAGDDVRDESMVRAQRVVHALGGAQRANFEVRLWLAMSGQIPWSFLPAIPSELFLLPPPAWPSPWRFSPWARGVLTPYYLIARAATRLQLVDARSLLLQRNDEAIVAPRLTRPGLAGDLLQAFDRTVKLSRKLPRGPLPRWGTTRAQRQLDDAQQRNGGWFSFRPTVLALVALRVMAAPSNDPRIIAGLDYLRRARGLARIRAGVGAGNVVLAQGLGGAPLALAANLQRDRPTEAELTWLVRQELCEPGPWQTRADASAGGWPMEPGSGHHFDLDATCAVLETLSAVPPGQGQVCAAWAATRRATDVILAMQEQDGAFARFERGEARVMMQRLPWSDADLLALGAPDDAVHVRCTARALAHLGRTGFRLDDDRVGRGLQWLQRAVADEHAHRSVTTLAAVGRSAAALCANGHDLRSDIERRLRTRQHENGSFGGLVATARALQALLALGGTCVQVNRAARWLCARTESLGDELAYHGNLDGDGFGLSPRTYDPSAGAREVVTALHALTKTTARPC